MKKRAYKENPFMCQVLRELMKEEIQEEIQAERQDAAQKATDVAWITAIKNLMKESKCDAATAMKKLCISANDQLHYIAML